MNTQPAQRAVTTMASPMIIGKDEPFITKLAFVVVALAIGVVCFVALMALVSVVMPKTAQRCKTVVGRWPLQAFATGLLAWAVGGGLAWFFVSHGYVPRLLRIQIVLGMLIPGVVISGVLMLLTVVGATGTVRFVGERLTGDSLPASPGRQIVIGTLACVLGSWFPVIGWAIATPALLCVSLGALLLSWARPGRLT